MNPFAPLLLGVVLTAACGQDPVDVRSETPPRHVDVSSPVPSSAAPAAPAGAVIGTAGPSVAYSCEALSSTVPLEVPAHPVVGQLLALAPLGSTTPTGAPDAITRALDALASTPLEDLSSRDRVLSQAALTRIAKRSDRLGREAARAAGRVALDAASLTALGSDPRPELERWLGPSEGWVERRGPSCGPLGAHDAVYAGDLAFRTVRSGALRVLFAQVVTFDTAWRPHVTPVVGLIELRTGMQADAPACVIEPTATGLHPVAFGDLHTSPFVQPTGTGQVGCGHCHGGQGPHDLSDLEREEGGAFRVERRIALLERATARGDELRALSAGR
jgi:hypothetical protein